MNARTRKLASGLLAALLGIGLTVAPAFSDVALAQQTREPHLKIAWVSCAGEAGIEVHGTAKL